jgi:acetolactate synthase-1/2/3 large subunit
MGMEHGGAVIARQLASHGVRHLFTLCGGHISPILTGSADNGIAVVDVRDEASAVFAADAMARMTGIPGVAAVTAGPGVTNTMTAVKNAQMAESPIIILGGATATMLKGRGSLQDIDQMSLMAPVTKWCTTARTVKSLPALIDRAVHVATEGVPGPVFIEIPVDLLYPEETVKEWYMAESGVDRMKGPAAIAVKTYLQGHLTRLFHAPHVDTSLGERAVDKGKQLARAPYQSAQAAQVARKVEAAKKPVLIVGSQALVNFSPAKAAQLADAIERLGMPTFLGGTARGLLGRRSDIQFRHKRSKALREADVVIVAGFPFDFRLGYGQKINRKGTLVSANLDPVALRKNRRPDVAVQQHPGEFVIELARRAAHPGHGWATWFEQLAERERARDAEIHAKGAHDGEHVHPIRFFEAMEEAMGPEDVLVVDGGDFVATGAYVLRPRAPLSWLDPGVFGTLGVGGGFALGAALARPDAQTWLVWGDGSSAYSLAEYDTYVRHGLAPIAVIGLDASWQQIARDQITILGTTLGCDLRHTAYHDVAKGYGGEGILVTSEDEIEGAIARAKELAAGGTPVVINIHLAESDFREGSMSM